MNNADEKIKALDNFSPANTAIVDKKFENELKTFKGEKDAKSTIKLTQYKPNYLAYEAKNLKADQLAVFSEIYYNKGWDAYIDGNKVPYLRANYLLRAMVIPAGDHKIEFKFEPKSYYVGEKSFAGRFRSAGFVHRCCTVFRVPEKESKNRRAQNEKVIWYA